MSQEPPVSPGASTGSRLQRHFALTRNRYLLLSDVALLPLAAVLAYAIRFAGDVWPDNSRAALAGFVALAIPLKVLVMWRMQLYSRLWRYAGLGDLKFLAMASLGAAFAGAVVGFVAMPLLPSVHARSSFAVFVLDAFLTSAFITAPRMLARILAGQRRAGPRRSARRVLIAGAGAAGSMIARELASNAHLGLLPVGFVDDDPSKLRRTLLGVPVVGRLSDLRTVIKAHAVEEVIIALPTAPGRVVRGIVTEAVAAGVPTRTVPGLFELLEGRKSVSALRKVEIADLLRREPVMTDMVLVRSLAAGRTVLVTGAGGSIGSELVRQLARLEPACIVVLGRGENSIFELIEECRRSCHGVRVEPIIADIRDMPRMERVFQTYRPHTVFHAAAHKHVPLMEANVSEAVLNNVLGTQVVASLAEQYGSEHFVLISSDKAVKPSSVMGATKRLAEGVVQEFARRSGRAFVSVRFGNVLGSRGSVVPTFMRQIEAGGPITITHEDMRRYFMTIPEAVQLVLQSGAMGQGGEVFVLDMGEAIRVVDLARDLIRLSGLVEGEDIDIRFTGVRPGEKLHEELFFGVEQAAPTSHEKILKARNATIGPDSRNQIARVIELARGNAPADDVRRAIHAIVPEYSGSLTREPCADGERAPSVLRHEPGTGSKPEMAHIA